LPQARKVEKPQRTRMAVTELDENGLCDEERLIIPECAVGRNPQLISTSCNRFVRLACAVRRTDNLTLTKVVKGASELNPAAFDS